MDLYLFVLKYPGKIQKALMIVGFYFLGWEYCVDWSETKGPQMKGRYIFFYKTIQLFRRMRQAAMGLPLNGATGSINFEKSN